MRKSGIGAKADVIRTIAVIAHQAISTGHQAADGGCPVGKRTTAVGVATRAISQIHELTHATSSAAGNEPGVPMRPTHVYPMLRNVRERTLRPP